MVDDTSNTPAGNGSQAGSGGEHAADNERQDATRDREIGGRGGLDPTRYGDWEKDGRCIDF